MPLLLRLLFDLANLALDLSSLTDAVTQIVELCTTYNTSAYNINFVQSRGMYRESTLYTYTVRDTSYRESLTYARTLTSDNNALKHLDTFTSTLDNLYMYTNRVTRCESRDVRTELFLF